MYILPPPLHDQGTISEMENVMKKLILLGMMSILVTLVWAGAVSTGDGKTRAEACANAKNAAGVFGTYETKECECSKREQDDTLYKRYPYTCAVERK